MTKKTFLSIKEAADIAGVSKKTIERAYKKHLDDPKLGKLIEKRQHGNGYRYFVSKSFVEKCVVGRTAASTKPKAADLSDTIAVTALREQLEVKDRRIDELMEMLSQKEKFNEALIRKGLNLPEGKTPQVNEPITEQDANASAATTDNAISNSDITTTDAKFVDAQVVAQEQGIDSSHRGLLFPTFRKGVVRIGELLRTDVGKRA